MSKGFLSALAGIGVTLLAWYGPWEWPGWPAFTVISIVFGHASFADLPFAARSAWIVALIIVNVSVWGSIAYALLRLVAARPRPDAAAQ